MVAFKKLLIALLGCVLLMALFALTPLGAAEEEKSGDNEKKAEKVEKEQPAAQEEKKAESKEEEQKVEKKETARPKAPLHIVGSGRDWDLNPKTTVEEEPSGKVVHYGDSVLITRRKYTPTKKD